MAINTCYNRVVLNSSSHNHNGIVQRSLCLLNELLSTTAQYKRTRLGLWTPSEYVVSFIVWILAMWSSSCVWISSTDAKMLMLLSLYLATLKIIGSQSACILFRAFSKLNSLLALTDTISKSAINGSRPILSTLRRVVPASGFKLRLAISLIFSQWRSRMPGLHSTEMTGIFFYLFN